MEKDFFLNWVINKKLAIGKAPRKIENLIFLREKGINSILSLCDENDFPNSEYLKNNFYHIRKILPDHRSKRIFTLDEISDTLKIIEKMLQNKPLYIHCLFAMERSPIICIAYLIKSKNLGLFEALSYLKQIHPPTNPSNIQLSKIKEFSFNLNKLKNKNNII